MKAQILKLSGHKNESDFYKEFPTQEAFMAKHGVAFNKLKKAQSSQVMRGNISVRDTNNNGIPDFQEGMAAGMGTVQTTTTVAPAFTSMFKTEVMPSVVAAEKGIGSAGRDINAGITAGAAEGAAKAQDTGQAIKTGVETADKIIGGFKALKAEKKALKSARTWRDVSGVVRQASETEDINTRGTIADTQRRTRKALMPTITGEELYPVQGVGTNVLARFGKIMQGGGEIMNTYSPEEDLYEDGGYEPMQESFYEDAGYTPLSDDEIVKAYKSGGLIPKAFWGSILGKMGGAGGGGGGGMMNMIGGMGGMMGGGGEDDDDGDGKPAPGTGKGGQIAQGIGGAVSSGAASMMGNNAGTQIGGGIGEGIGSIFGPAGKAIGGAVGTIAGGLIDTNPKKIKAAQDKMMKNMGVMSGMGNIRSMREGNPNVMEHGGYMDYAEDGGDYPNPRVITHFGEYPVNQLFRQDPMMDTLRSGGNIRQNSVGDIEAISGGHLQPMSYNPYDDGSGYTSMIKGQTHEENNGRHTGVLMRYNRQDGGDMGEPQDSEPQVEAENNEPIKEIGDDAVIFGDIVINDKTVMGDPQFQAFHGKTFKKAMEGVANEDKKLNKFQDKNTKELLDFNPRTPFDKLKFNSLSMNEKGIDQRYRINSGITKKAAQYQQAVNDAADELGINAGAFSRGKIAPSINLDVAEDGITLLKAQSGMTPKSKRLRQEKEAKEKAYAKAHPMEAKIKEGYIPEAIKSTKTDSKGNIILSFTDGSKDIYYTNGRIAQFNDKGVLEYKGGWNKKTGDTTGMDYSLAEEQEKARDVFERAGFNNNINTPSVGDIVAQGRPQVARQSAPATASQRLAAGVVDPVTNAPLGAPAGAPAGGQRAAAPRSNPPVTRPGDPTVQASTPGKWNYIPAGRTGVPEWDTPEGYAKWTTDVGEATADSPRADQMLKYMEGVSGPGSAEIKAALGKIPTREGKIAYLKEKATDNQVGPMHYVVKAAMEATKKGETKPTPGTPAAKPEEEGRYPVAPYKKTGLETILGQVMPWFRKQPGEGLQGDQLAGEMFALSHNQEEPVQARFYHPQLDTPYDISYQDRLNENQATFNSMKQAAGRDPVALSALAGQKYAADSSVLAEQFRANQAMKQQVYTGNRQTLNQAQQFNLGIADTQYTRQAQAKANTKEVKQEALNSIAAKIGQNRSENRTLQTYANMFPDFSYDRNYRIRKTGAPADIDIPVIYNEKGQATHVRVLDADGKTINYKPLSEEYKDKTATAAENENLPIPMSAAQEIEEEKKKKAKKRQGGIVQAFKNI